MEIDQRKETVKNTVLLADDCPLIREALRIHIEKQKDLEVIAETGDGQEAVDLVSRLLPDVAVIDADMPLMNGIEATKRISEKYPSVEVLILTDHDDTLHIVDIIKSGASGYLLKSSSAEVIIHYVRKIAKGERAFPITVLKDISVATIGKSSPFLPAKGEDLNNKELTILKYIARGLSNKDIARRLGFSVNYIKSSISTIFIKLGVSSRTEAIAAGLKSKIISLEDMVNNHFTGHEDNFLDLEK